MGIVSDLTVGFWGQKKKPQWAAITTGVPKMGLLSGAIGLVSKVAGKATGLLGGKKGIALAAGVAGASALAGAAAAPGPLFGAKKKKRRRRARLTTADIRDIMTLKAVIGERAFARSTAGQMAIMDVMRRG